MVILIFIGYEEDIGGILALGVRYIFMFWILNFFKELNFYFKLGVEIK
jgi:hypothetical protein